MKKISIISLCLLKSLWVCSQITSTPNFMCRYYGQGIDHSHICEANQFASSHYAEEVIDKILRPIGLTRNFVVMECPNTDNCFATTVKGIRYVVYDNKFLQKIDNHSQTDWAAISIMAHEVGHHLQGHTIDGKGSRPEKELEADKFSGFVLHQLGASLENSQAAINALQDDLGNATHPPRLQRLARIAQGWNDAESIYPKFGKEDMIEEEIILTENKESKVIQTTNIPTLNDGCISGNCESGIGVFVHKTLKERYDGSWKDGKRNGFGTHYNANGTKKYEGNFVLGKREGKGILYYANGDSYHGLFYDNKRNGNGIYIHANGEEEEIYYENDKKINDEE